MSHGRRPRRTIGRAARRAGLPVIAPGNTSLRRSRLPEPPPRLLILGAGGHAKALLDTLRAAGWPPPAGLLDDDPARGPVLGLAVLGPLSRLAELRGTGLSYALVALGDNHRRAELGDRAQSLGYTLATLQHPAATRADSAELGPGSVMLPRAVLGADARTGRLAILNTAAVAEHDCRLGHATHLAPGATLTGGVTLGDFALVGAGATILPGLTIGAHATIGAGAAVTQDVPEGARAVGVPARIDPVSGAWSAAAS